MSVALYGKHPAFGDFVSTGLDRDAVATLEVWMQDVLPATREALGEAWDSVWESAPDLRFWIGPEVLGVPLFGIWRASQDKVGRKYPLMLGLSGSVTPPPVHPAHASAPFDALAAHLEAMEGHSATQGGAQALIDGFEVPPVTGAPYDAAQAGMLWGMRGDDDLDRLFRDAADADAVCAQYARSHWWQPGSPDREAGWLSVNGLPGAGAMRWLLSERVRVDIKTGAFSTQPDEDEEDQAGSAWQ